MNKDVNKILNVSFKTWLISGVAGFIGSNLLETLLKQNQFVVGLADISKAKQLLGYTPSHQLQAGLREAVKWYIANS
jgi:nucleoside-diphosphate-sugar epimerase